MSYVITSACIGCKCGRCAEMCPTKAIREGDMMLFIDPDECVDCEGDARANPLRMVRGFRAKMGKGEPRDSTASFEIPVYVQEPSEVRQLVLTALN